MRGGRPRLACIAYSSFPPPAGIVFAMAFRVLANNAGWADHTQLEEISNLTPTADITMLNGTGRAAMKNED
eukprot:4856744-Pyramimonas_sp.AAC.1